MQIIPKVNLGVDDQTGITNFTAAEHQTDSGTRLHSTENVLSFPAHTDYFHTPDGMRIRYGYWAGKNRRGISVVLLNGRSEFLEKYGETVACLNCLGMDVFSMDWRGQGLSGRMVQDRQKGHVAVFSDYLLDLETFFFDIVFPFNQQPVWLLSHSMGGHIALHFLIEKLGQSLMAGSTTGAAGDDGTAERIKGAVFVSPMFDIQTWPFPYSVARMLSRIMVSAGFEKNFAAGNGPYKIEEQKFKDNRLTSDPVRFRDHIRAVAANPDLAVGGVTYGWLKAAFDSIDELKKSVSLASVSLPMMIVSAERDAIVSEKAQINISRRLANCKIISIPGARHEILKESDSIQQMFWSAFKSFCQN